MTSRPAANVAWSPVRNQPSGVNASALSAGSTYPPNKFSPRTRSSPVASSMRPSVPSIATPSSESRCGRGSCGALPKAFGHSDEPYTRVGTIPYRDAASSSNRRGMAEPPTATARNGNASSSCRAASRSISSSTKGAPPQTVTRCSMSRRSEAAGEKASSRMSRPPRSSARCSCMTPVILASGLTRNAASCAVNESRCAMLRTPASRLPSVCTTALGRLLVPEVKTITSLPDSAISNPAVAQA
jgi:hypothetical protein